MFETEQQRERAVLISIEDSLDELELLVKTTGAETVGKLTQNREAVHPGHYLGKGKIDELKAIVKETDADAVIADDELTSAQLKNMSQLLGVKVLDRTSVILDIFASRASSAEGRAQVELAQLKYRQSRLTGLGVALSRQAGGGGIHGGGIGTRGPGEKKLETDRRHIRGRIDQLNRELAEIREGRSVLRKKRLGAGVPVVALVGYTNAGKSTLMNALTGAGVLAEDKLFATLETTTRKAALQTADGAFEVLFTDTVGFIHKLPHHLIQAFRATLEELAYADVLVHVVDYSFPGYAGQMETVLKTLCELECAGKPIITAFNKIDRATDGNFENLPESPCVYISAQTGKGIPNMLSGIEKILKGIRREFTVLIPYSEGNLVNLLHKDAEITEEKHKEDGTFIKGYADERIAGMIKRFAF